MLFSSVEFILFFIVYIIIHLTIKPSYRLWLMVLGSTVFYGWWKPSYVWLPYMVTLIGYFGAIWSIKYNSNGGTKTGLALPLIVLFTPLFIFKYANFIYDNVAWLLSLGSHSLFNLSLPLGISFISFTLAAYVVDTYQGKFPKGNGLVTILGYVLFFPHLIAGPILRPHELIPQLKRFTSASTSSIYSGLAIFTLGLIKKILFADQLGEIVDHIFAGHGHLSAGQSLLAIYAFTIQIYCDFSGYTDMAIGLARMMGIRLPTNFLRPYASHSPIEFWRRWHVTLSLWLRDYIYIPLGGNRKGNKYCNIMLTMLIAGLWHGANWTFVLWGGLHGLGLLLAHAWRKWSRRPAIPKWLSIFLCFNFVALLWVFFRSPDINTALYVISHIFVGGWQDMPALISNNAFYILLMLIFGIAHYYDTHSLVRLAAFKSSKAITLPIILLCWILAITVSQGSSAKFIYFDF